MQYTQHPIGALLPPQTPEERESLRESLRHGYSGEPIWLYEGQVLIGWHRYELGMELVAEGVEIGLEFDEFQGSDEGATAMVLKSDVVRRSVSASQKAEIARRLGTQRDLPIGEIARVYGVGQVYLSHAVQVAKLAPDLSEGIRLGKFNVADAYAIREYGHELRAAAVARVESGASSLLQAAVEEALEAKAKGAGAAAERTDEHGDGGAERQRDDDGQDDEKDYEPGYLGRQINDEPAERRPMPEPDRAPDADSAPTASDQAPAESQEEPPVQPPLTREEQLEQELENALALRERDARTIAHLENQLRRMRSQLEDNGASALKFANEVEDLREQIDELQRENMELRSKAT